MKQFITAASEADELEEGERKDLVFMIDDREVTAYFPGDGQIAVYMATTASFASKREQVAGALNFFVSVFDEDTHSWVVSRLFDRTDDFGLKQVTDILQYMMEEWTGNPTVAPSTSTRSRPTTSRRSTRPTPALT
jgi:hypothetical protein